MLNFSEIKQIVLEAKFWSNRCVVVVIGDKRGFMGQSSPQGQTAGEYAVAKAMADTVGVTPPDARPATASFGRESRSDIYTPPPSLKFESP